MKDLVIFAIKKITTKREREREQIHQYFTKHNIRSAKIEGDKLLIEYNNSQKVSKEITNELQQIKGYIEIYHSNQQLSLSDLQKSKEENGNNKPTNYLPYILGGVGIVVVVIGLVWLVKRKKAKE